MGSQEVLAGNLLSSKRLSTKRGKIKWVSIPSRCDVGQAQARIRMTQSRPILVWRWPWGVALFALFYGILNIIMESSMLVPKSCSFFKDHAVMACIYYVFGGCGVCGGGGGGGRKVTVCVCLCMCLCICVCESVYLCMCESLCMCLYVCCCVSVSVCLCMYVCVCVYVSVSVCLCLYACVCVSVCLCLCICVYVSMCLCVYVSMCLCVYVSMTVPVCLCVRPPATPHLYLLPRIHP